MIVERPKPWETVPDKVLELLEAHNALVRRVEELEGQVAALKGEGVEVTGA